MKTSLRKLVAMICVLAIAAVLPVMASAEGTTLALTAPETAKAGETIAVTLAVSGNEGWDLLDATFTASEGLTAVKSLNEWEEEEDALTGGAFGSAMASVNLEQGLIGAIAANAVKRNGDLLTISFKLADDAADGEYTVEMTINSFSESIVENGAPAGKHDRVAPGTKLTATVKVGDTTPPTESTAAPTESTAAPTESTAAPTVAPTQGTVAPTVAPTQGTVAPTVAPTEDTDVVVDPTEDVDVTTATDAEEEGDVATGEPTTLIVLALVLMAGSAVALISMKKKALSK